MAARGRPPKTTPILLETICEEAERLDCLVRNLLDMTRLESGSMVVKREWVPLEEMVGSALARLETQLGGRPISVNLPAGFAPHLGRRHLVGTALREPAGKCRQIHAPRQRVDLTGRALDHTLVIQVGRSRSRPSRG